MKIVCPGSTPETVPTPPQASTSKRVLRAHSSSLRRTRVVEKERNAKVAHASEAKRRRDKRQEAQGRAKASNVTHVFVGNLQSTITQQRLKDCFQDCGMIINIIIRCSSGQALSGIAFPLAVRSERDRQYATVQFKHAKSAKKALAYNGKVLDGCKLVVSASALDLPEVQEIVSTHMKRLKQIDALPTPGDRLLQGPNK